MTVSDFFLKTNFTKDEGMNGVAKYYKVEQDWTNYKKTMGCITPIKKNTLIC
jgi:hypothetical protein